MIYSYGMQSSVIVKWCSIVGKGEYGNKTCECSMLDAREYREKYIYWSEQAMNKLHFAKQKKENIYSQSHTNRPANLFILHF